tara:strand:- start:22572 stop:23603 length:1032 start_codon:yes stop_codon:yes gene_type:complete
MQNQSEIDLTVVIPTWNRTNKLIECISSLLNQTYIPEKYEIIVCDSNSPDLTEKYVSKFLSEINEKRVRLLQCKYNNTSLKRNTGIKESKFNYIILLDDDCIPYDDFIDTYCKLLKKNDSSILFCGEYRIRDELLKSNYSRYRDSRYFGSKKWNISKDKHLDFQSVITGNMAFNKRKIIENSLFFNEGMVGYGLQDIEWSWNLKKNSLKILKCDAKVYHDETSGNIYDYREKIFFVAKDAMVNLKKVNPDAAMNYKYYFLENESKFTLKKIFFFLIFNSFIENTLIRALSKLMFKLDKLKFFYFPIVYKVLVISAWIKGIKKRDQILLTNDDTKKGWYAKGDK